MTRGLIVGLVALVLAGCMAPLPRIDAGGVTAEQFDKDRFACWSRARNETPAVSTEPHPSIVAGLFIVALGLIALGASPTDFADTGPSPQELERSRAVEGAAETCMVERGYALKDEAR